MWCRVSDIWPFYVNREDVVMKFHNRQQSTSRNGKVQVNTARTSVEAGTPKNGHLSLSPINMAHAARCLTYPVGLGLSSDPRVTKEEFSTVEPRTRLG
jgi:hypothetical protein